MKRLSGKIENKQLMRAPELKKFKLWFWSFWLLYSLLLYFQCISISESFSKKHTKKSTKIHVWSCGIDTIFLHEVNLLCLQQIYFSLTCVVSREECTYLSHLNCINISFSLCSTLYREHRCAKKCHFRDFWSRNPHCFASKANVILMI